MLYSYTELGVIRSSCATRKHWTGSTRRSIQDHRGNVRFSRFSPSFQYRKLVGYLPREKERARQDGGEAKRAKKRSRLMEKVRKQQENKQPGCSRRDAFALKCPKLGALTFSSYFYLFLRETRQNGHRDAKRRLQKGRKRLSARQNVSRKCLRVTDNYLRSV